MNQTEATKHVLDGISAVTVLGTLTQILPPLAALFTILWTILRIYESKTVQTWLGNDKATDTE